MNSFSRRLGRAVQLVVGSAPEKKRARHGLASTVASSMGFRIYGPEASWYVNDEFAAVWADFPGTDGFMNDRRFNLYNLAKALSVLDGDLAECGVNIGRGSYLMLAANADSQKHLYGFDSFEGLSEPRPDDRPRDSRAKSWQVNDLAADEATARGNLSAFDGRFTLLKGWIPECFDQVSDKSFSLVHVDVDLYEPTRDSIEFFWPRLVPGGLLICDDYGSRRCPGARKAMDEFARSQQLKVAELSSMQGLLLKPTNAEPTLTFSAVTPPQSASSSARE